MHWMSQVQLGLPVSLIQAQSLQFASAPRPPKPPLPPHSHLSSPAMYISFSSLARQGQKEKKTLTLDKVYSWSYLEQKKRCKEATF